MLGSRHLAGEPLLGVAQFASGAGPLEGLVESRALPQLARVCPLAAVPLGDSPRSR